MSDFQAIADRVEIEALRGEFTERVYEVRYLDTTPLAGSAPRPAGTPANGAYRVGPALNTSPVRSRGS